MWIAEWKGSDGLTIKIISKIFLIISGSKSPFLNPTYNLDVDFNFLDAIWSTSCCVNGIFLANLNADIVKTFTTKFILGTTMFIKGEAAKASLA